ncbi:MAG: carboxypeptidase regulatory-like domain-containing protein [Coriobacteriales bacterium]|jgi:Fe-S-cluster-containing dehydrogenase component|nr:carboxypeptidase regulatory-like domain-containing protein [Coriobacteriales bacterium]
MTKVFLVDLSHCNGCYNCQIVCKDEHCGQDWQPYAAAQPDTGQFWMRLDEKERGQVPWVRVAHTPIFCSHCADPACAAACSSNAFERRDDGLIVLSPQKCTGCRDCLDACPLGVIYFNEQLNIAQKCTGCAHLLDNGWEVPRCVDACAHEVIRYAEESEFGDLLRDAETLPAMDGCGARVYYRNLPRRFMAGSVVDLKADELLIGAEVKARASDGTELTLMTDDLGDFKFDQIAPDMYQLTISAKGFQEHTLTADLRDIDRSLGDIALTSI